MKLSSTVKYFFPGVINRKGHGLFPAILVLLVLASPHTLCQDNAQRPSKSVAEDAWDRGNYETAYEQYNGLLLLYSRDPLYKYYTGACLVRLQRDIPRAIDLLGSAINNAVMVKSVPDDVWFWYGRALQMNGSFSQATDAYDKFTRTAGRRTAQEYNVAEYLDQCNSGQGAIGVERRASVSGPTSGGKEQAGVRQPAETGPAKREGKEQGITSAEPLAQSPEKRAPVEEKKELSREITGTDVTNEYESILAEAVAIQHQADSLTHIAEGARRDLEKAAPEGAGERQHRTEEMEKMAADKQKEADNLFARLEDQNTQPAAVIPEKKPQPQQAAVIPEKMPQPQQAAVIPEKKPQTQQAAVIPEKKPQPQQAKILSRFEVKPYQSYNSNNPVPVDTDLPEGLVYTIQIAAFKNPPDPALFRGLFPVYGKMRQESGVTFYYTGLFRRIEDARQALPKAREAGFPDAFIIALLDDTRVSMERAAMLENEWGGQPLPGEPGDDEKAASVESSDSVTVGTLSFRAEVMRLEKPAKPELIEKLTLLAGTRGLDIIKNNNDETVYLIGNFITFDSAEDYVSLLIRNGYSSARVAAYVGRYEISVEAAKELIKGLSND